jgi:antitoxin PrlF
MPVWQASAARIINNAVAAPEASPSRNARILVSRKAVSHIVDMNRQTRQPSVFSKVSVKSQTVIPREVRERLRLRPGDTLRYRMTEEGIVLDKAPASETDDPFTTFSEWSNEADAKAYDGL